MNDAAPMRVRERVEHVVQNARHRARRELPGVDQRIAQRHALDEWHRVPQQIAMLAGVEHGHDMWVLELRDEHDLATESLAIHAGPELGL